MPNRLKKTWYATRSNNQTYPTTAWLAGNVGYIKLDRFLENSGDEVTNALVESEKE